MPMWWAAMVIGAVNCWILGVIVKDVGAIGKTIVGSGEKEMGGRSEKEGRAVKG